MGTPPVEQPIELDAARWERWVQWIGRVRTDVKAALVDRLVFRGFDDIVRKNLIWIDGHSGMRFCQFVALGYVARVALTVRRHSRDHKDAITLRGILQQMLRCTSEFTIDFYLER